MLDPERYGATNADVALHPEGVDRNIALSRRHLSAVSVALHPEGVDRNLDFGETVEEVFGRPPPGGRG